MNPLLHLLTGLTALAVMGTVSVTDPTGDSVGDGTLVAPTAPRYANNAIFDLQDVVLERVGGSTSGSIILLPAETGSDEETGSEPSSDDQAQDEDGVETTEESRGQSIFDVRSVLTITLGAVDVNDTTALGFGSVVIDAYLDSAPGGHVVTLDGPGMLLPAGQGWEYAVRLTPDGATGYRYLPPAEPVESVTAVPTDEAGDAPAGAENEDALGTPDLVDDEAAVTPQPAFESVPVGVTLVGSTLVIEMPWLFESEVTVYAMTGVHDPFNPTGWRPLADAPSPWAFSGGEQVVPVIDLLAPTQEAQERALRTGVLPLPAVPVRDTGTLWLLLMALGLATAVAGLVLRRRVPSAGRASTGTRGKTPLRTGLPPEADSPTARPRTVPVPPVGIEHLDDDGPEAPAEAELEPEPPREPRVSPEPQDTPAEPTSGAEDDGVESKQDDAEEVAESAAVEVVADEPATSGISAFDSFVLFEEIADEEEAAEGFDELTQGRAGSSEGPTN